MTQSMIERVARAICAKTHDEFNGWCDLGEDERDGFRAAASAAIEAMSEPTDAMLEAMEEMYTPFGEMRAAWDGAIIAALNEQVSG